MPGAVFASGDRVELRTLEEGDYEALRDVSNHLDVRRFIGFRRPLNLEQQRSFLEQEAAKEGKIVLGICVDGDLVGNVAVEEVRPGVGDLFVLVDPAHQRQGYATEALELLVIHAFEDLRHHKVMARVYGPNRPSVRLFERLGFEREAALREHVYVDGAYEDLLVYGLLAREWDG